MADPRNANRARLAHPSIVAAASVAASRLSAPFPHFWEEEDEEAVAVTGGTFPDMDAEDAEREEYLKDRKRETDQDRESRRDERQYRTAFRTAFELGVKAGRMQRAEPQPCAACERRKERNRIAAQASRFEKRRLERSLAGLAGDAPRRQRRPTGGVVPPPLIPAPRVSTQVATAVKVQESEEEDEDEELEPPPF
jgi:hypothetical protein